MTAKRRFNELIKAILLKILMKRLSNEWTGNDKIIYLPYSVNPCRAHRRPSNTTEAKYFHPKGIN